MFQFIKVYLRAMLSVSSVLVQPLDAGLAPFLQQGQLFALCSLCLQEPKSFVKDSRCGVFLSSASRADA